MSRRRLGGESPELAGVVSDPLEAMVVDAPPSAEASHGSEGAPTPEPRIYAASLSDYNAGVLHGAWVDAGTDVDTMQSEIDRMLAASPTADREGTPAEEWAIHDVDGWGRFIDIDEFDRLEVIARLAEGVGRFGEAFGAWTEVIGVNDDEAVNQFEEFFIGEFRSLEDFGQQQLDDLGFDISVLPCVPESVRGYVHVDVAGWVRDMELNGTIVSQEGGAGVYLFWSL